MAGHIGILSGENGLRKSLSLVFMARGTFRIRYTFCRFGVNCGTRKLMMGKKVTVNWVIYEAKLLSGENLLVFNYVVMFWSLF